MAEQGSSIVATDVFKVIKECANCGRPNAIGIFELYATMGDIRLADSIV